MRFVFCGLAQIGKFQRIADEKNGCYVRCSFVELYKRTLFSYLTDKNNHNDGSFTAVITQVADVEFKCWNRRDWAYEECQPDGSNIPNRQYKFKDTPVANITIAKWKKMATGIDELKSDFTYPVSVSDRKVTVDGVVSGVSLYNISGQLIQNFKGNGKFVSRPLTSGVYILQVDNAERKVMVD